MYKCRPHTHSLSRSLCLRDIITSVDWNSEVMAHKSSWSMVTETKLQDTLVPLSSQRTTGDAFLQRCKGDFCCSCVIVSFIWIRWKQCCYLSSFMITLTGNQTVYQTTLSVIPLNEYNVIVRLLKHEQISLKKLFFDQTFIVKLGKQNMTVITRE